MNKLWVTFDDNNEHDHPSPCEFDDFMPWACRHLQVEATIEVTKAVQREYISTTQGPTDRSKSRKLKVYTTPSRLDRLDKRSKEDMSPSKISFPIFTERIVKIHTTYDSNEELVEIKFETAMAIPQKIIKIINLIVQFHPSLNTVTINHGLDVNVVHELSNLLNVSHITNVCLDDSFFDEASYDALLEKQSLLKYLSLVRCRINDAVVKKIASKLVYPLPASKTLSILNLSSNRITDVGAKYLGEALRSNRCLSYLNLADNAISDDGADSILKNLVEFSITKEEQQAARAKYMTFLKAKNAMIIRLLKDAIAIDINKKANKRKPTKPPVISVPKKPKPSVEMLFKRVRDKSIVNVNELWLEKIEIMAGNRMGEFKHAYSTKNIFVKDGVVYCTGNNTLCYLNLAYNSLSYCSVKRLLQVLKAQKINNKNQRGLVNVSIEGNCLPTSCIELLEIDELLDIRLMSQPLINKKPSTRNGHLKATQPPPDALQKRSAKGEPWQK